MTPAQRDAMQKALTALQSLNAPTMTLVAMQDEAISELSTALSQEPEQSAAEGGLRVPIVGQWYTDGSMVISHGNEEDGDLNIADCWDEATARRIVELHNAAYTPHPAAANPSKKAGNVDTSGPHVDGIDTLAADSRDAEFGRVVFNIIEIAKLKQWSDECFTRHLKSAAKSHIDAAMQSQADAREGAE